MTKVHWQGGCSLLLCLVLLAGAGCARTHGVEAHREGIQTDSPQLVVHNKDLADKIDIVDIKGRYEGDLLRQTVVLQNMKKKTLGIKYKFAWFDDDGFPVDPDGQAWAPLVLHGRESKTVRGIAPNPRASSFRIVVRWADK